MVLLDVCFFFTERKFLIGPDTGTQLPVTSKMYDCPRLSVIWRSDPFTGRGAMLVGLKREFVRGVYRLDGLTIEAGRKDSASAADAAG